MKVAELTGAMLDKWVARAKAKGGEDWQQTFYGQADVYGAVCRFEPRGKVYSPSQDWNIAGPIIEQECIDTVWSNGEWEARTQLEPAEAPHMAPCYRMTGETCLIAAMRAFVAAKFGDEVPEQGEKP